MVPSPIGGNECRTGRRDSGRAGMVNANDDAKVESMSSAVALLHRQTMAPEER